MTDVVDAHGASIHHSSYRSRVSLHDASATTARIGRFDAVVVPTRRTVDHLEAAVDLAERIGVTLVLLCSGESDGRRAAALVNSRPGAPDCLIIDVPTGYAHDVLTFSTSAYATRIGDAGNDVALKRNIALMIGAMAGWRNVLFLDDDVRGFSPAAHDRTLSGLAAHEAAGWAFSNFYDNSVVCHAHRLAGGVQDTFIGGGAMGVRISSDLPFFPRVYNEDWLFLFDLVARESVSLLGEMQQIAYDPYATSVLARKQERGDVLAEGLFGLFHSGGGVEQALDAGFWAGEVQARRAFISDIGARLRGIPALTAAEADVQKRARFSLATAHEALNSDVAPLLAAWVRAWRNDADQWRERLTTFQGIGDLDVAVKWLDLQDVTLRLPRRQAPLRTGWGAQYDATRRPALV